MNPVVMIRDSETSGVQPVMSDIAQAVSPRPANSSHLISILPISFPTKNIHNMVPMPRGPMAMPAVTTGYPISVCR